MLKPSMSCPPSVSWTVIPMARSVPPTPSSVPRWRDVSDLYASACTFADAKNDWAASYIAYCAQTGIVAGRNATTFDPNGKVTGIETAKMLLCVLGFDAATQGYVGTNWKTNILRDAKDHGLLDGFAADYDPDKAITREEAAQMMLNALQANIVIGTISGNLVKITNTIYVDKYHDVHISIADAEKEGWVVLTRNNVVISKTRLASIYKGLEVNPGFDCYHNPGFVWTYTNSKGTVVFEKFYPSAATYSYTKKATLATDLKEEINSKKYYDVQLYVDGEYQDTYNLTKENVNHIANAVTGYGVLTNVYVNDYFNEDDGRVIITVKNTYIGTVTNVSKLQGTFKLNNVNAVAYDNTDYGFKTGDIVLYWLCGESGLDLHDAKIAEPVTGACTRVELATDEFESTTKVDGKTYNYNRNFGTVERFDNIIMTLDEVWASTNNGTTYDLFLDEYGYVMAWRVHTTEHEYVYAYAVENTGVKTPGTENIDGTTNDKYTNDMVTFDAKYNEDVEINAAAWDAIKAMGLGTLFEKGLLMRYEVIDGVATYDPDAVPSDRAIQAGEKAYLDVNGNVHRPGDRDPEVQISYGDDDTQYMVRTWNYEQKKFEYNVYTRDQLTVGLAGYKYDSTGAVMATIQYFLDPATVGNNSAHLDYVFVDALYQRSAQKAFVYGDLERIVCDDLFVNQIFAYSAYPAMINGEKAYLAVTGEHFGDTVLNTVPWLYQADLQVIGLVDGKTPVYANMTKLENYGGEGERLVYNDGNIDALGFGSFKVDKDCVVVVIDEATDSYLKLETPADINDYFEELQTNKPADKNGYYDYVAYWLFNDGVQYERGENREGTVDEVFIIVENGVHNGNFGGQH